MQLAGSRSSADRNGWDDFSLKKAGNQTGELIKINNNPHLALWPHSALCLTVATPFILRIFHILNLEVSSTLLTSKRGSLL